MNPSDIMIVDDTPANLKLLEDMLHQQGLQVRSFPLGRLAIAAAIKHPPDLILLDVNMPEMNGYEVCESLKSTGELANIPVIFLSALTDLETKVKAFQAGAVDYISKPFQVQEVHARVNTHLKLHQLQEELRLQNELLEEAVAERTRELAEAMERLTILDRSKSDFLNLISHEFRTPLNGLLGVGDLILDGAPHTEDNQELRVLFQRSRRRILSILEDALLLAQIDVSGEQFRCAPVSLNATLHRAIMMSHEFAVARLVAVIPPAASSDYVLGEEELLARAMQALLETAIRFSRTNGSVQLSCGAANGSCTVLVETAGVPIPESALASFFDLFSIGQAITPGGDFGLGPAVASRILSLFGASVNVVNLNPPGIRFTISLQNAG